VCVRENLKMAKVGFTNAKKAKSKVTLTFNVYAYSPDNPAFLFSLSSPCVSPVSTKTHIK